VIEKHHDSTNAIETDLPWPERSDARSTIAISSISGSEDYGYDSVSRCTMKAAPFFCVTSFARHVVGKGIRANVRPIPLAAWRAPGKSPTPRSSWPARTQASSPAQTLLWTGH
jgi:hypothetical protein